MTERQYMADRRWLFEHYPESSVTYNGKGAYNVNVPNIGSFTVHLSSVPADLLWSEIRKRIEQIRLEDSHGV